ncbi:MAG: hypothetical protein JNL58_13455 [Planctomyces sp.]|nr:hypothetical protein [Planctomyces sp.]
MSQEPQKSGADPLAIQLDDLVAYLDGELSDVEADVIERRLVTDTPLRKQAEDFDRTWQLLDSLGEVSASREFTQKTLSSMTATTDTDGVDEDESGISKKTDSLTKFLLRQMIWLTAGLGAGYVGLTAGQWNADRQQNSVDARILQNLDMFQNYYQYHLIPDTKFLRDIKFPEELNVPTVPGTLTPSSKTEQNP